MKKRAISFLMIVFMISALIPDVIFNRTVHASAFDDINQPEVFLKQVESRTCTLVSAVMIIRRAAILQGDPDWKSITIADVKKVAWNDGLSWDFSYKHNGITYRIIGKTIPDKVNRKDWLISMLETHPEGIEIFRNYDPNHAVLLTDYTDGIFYCADPASGKPTGRMDVSNAYSVTTENAKRYWYLASPKCSLDSSFSDSDPEYYKVSFSRTLFARTSGSYMNGEDVLQMQMCLKYLGYSIDTDGVYGPATASAVKSFQSDYGVSPVDGYCGAVTWASIENAVNDKKQTGTGCSFTASLKSPQIQNTTVRLTASGGSKYKFYTECGGKWERIQDVSTKNSVDWKPTKAGTYHLYVDVTDVSGQLLACKKMTYVITEAVLSAGSASPQELGTTVKLTAMGGQKYKFYSECGGKWEHIQDVSTKNTCEWKPSKAGTYHVYVDIMDGSGNLLVCRQMKYVIVKASLTADATSPQETDSAIKLTATGGEKYKFYSECGGNRFYSECGGVWTRLRDFDVSNAYNWHATSVGTNTVYCDVKDGSGKVVCVSVKYQIVKGTSFVADLSASMASGQTGTEMKLKAGSINGSGTVKYKFYCEKDGVWTNLKNYGTQNYLMWTPEATGFYNLYVDAKDSKGNIASKRLNMTVAEGPLRIKSFTANPDSIITGGTVSLDCAAVGGKGTVTYKFYSECGGLWTRIRNFNTQNSAVWKPAKAGAYNVYVEAKDESGTVESRKLRVNVTEELKASMTAQYTSPQNAGTTIRLTVNVTGGTGAFKYKFYSECDGIWTKLWDFDDRSTYNWHATTVGTHRVYCDVEDSSGKTVCSKLSYKIVKGTDFVADLNANRVSGQYTGTEIRLMAGCCNSQGTVKYKYYVEKGGKWSRLKDYSTQDYFLWTPAEPGFYNVYVDAKDSGGESASKRLCFTVEQGTPLRVKSLIANPSSPTKGSSVKLTGATTGGDGNVTCKFYYELNGSWVQIRGFSESKTCSFTPSQAGTYHIYMDAIDGKKNTQCRMITVTVK